MDLGSVTPCTQTISGTSQDLRARYAWSFRLIVCRECPTSPAIKCCKSLDRKRFSPRPVSRALLSPAYPDLSWKAVSSSRPLKRLVVGDNKGS